MKAVRNKKRCARRQGRKYALGCIFDDYVKNRGMTLAPGSLAKHRSNMRNHIAPHFGERPIGSISPGEVINFVVGLRRQLAYSTAKSVLATMAKLWRYAYELGMIERELYIELFLDSATRITVPRLPGDRRQSRPEVYTCRQIQEFMALAGEWERAYSVLIALCYYGGLRLSEALGLRWEDVDLESGKIVVRYQLTYDKNEHITFLGPTKNKIARSFPAPPVLTKLLAEWKSEQMAYPGGAEALPDRVENCLVRGGSFVLRDSRGRIINHSRANHLRERLQRCTGEHFYYHALRHTVVSRLAGAGVPLKNVSDYIGHSSTRTTEKFYLAVDEIGEEKLHSAIGKL